MSHHHQQQHEDSGSHLEQSFNQMMLHDDEDVHHNHQHNDQMDGSYYADEGAESLAESMNESMFSGADNDESLYEEGAVPDVMLLNVYCARARAAKTDDEVEHQQAETSWQPVRDYLANHSADEVRAAAEQRGESGLTALHFAARHDPPLDVVDVLLSIAVDTVQWPDSFGWLPIHYACASGSDTEVIKALAEAYPESKTVVDRRGRTPLHFALGDKPASPDVIFLLASTGAASFPDEIGMLVSYYSVRASASVVRASASSVIDVFI